MLKWDKGDYSTSDSLSYIWYRKTDHDVWSEIAYLESNTQWWRIVHYASPRDKTVIITSLKHIPATDPPPYDIALGLMALIWGP